MGLQLDMFNADLNDLEIKMEIVQLRRTTEEARKSMAKLNRLYMDSAKKAELLEERLQLLEQRNQSA